MITVKEMLKNHSENEKVSFHMPGHKGCKSVYDVTELSDTDDLLMPESSIKGLLSRLSISYGESNAYIGTNGSTGLLMATLMNCGKEKKVVLPRCSHQSIYYGLIQNNHQPVYLEPHINSEGYLCPPKSEGYELQIGKGDVFVFCTPTYEGFMENYENLKVLLGCEKTILDGAHGSHLHFMGLTWNRWIEFKVFSFHKTLGGLNQTSVLLTKNRKIEKYLPFYQTTSPSFPHILSVETSLDDLDKCNLEKKNEAMKNFKDSINQIKGFRVIKTDDISKLLIEYNQYIEGNKLVSYLKQKGIFYEVEGNHYLLGILTIYDEPWMYEYCLEVFSQVSEIWHLDDSFSKNESSIHIPKICLLPGEAFYESKILVDLETSIGRISGEFYTPYPPGIPLLVPGEIIDASIIENILLNKGAFHGNHQLSEDKIMVIK
ncbi:hypothetical protein AZF37_08220 [endosymbiont 'TC1' of Trimyema compressum]|uniref:Orn/Lys/Arg family decarboxylase n=1 Tax=endosymbiont 'TC1' of Trimyema compressum TaxID=243899 RepID=UPI0007F0A224|nr:hypothetical protein [endosymbiont 'TC1' of Trimyema compressum]AMP21145.1 hypothetical protein AZF37_08220 [endosymbiont 'TC1' of Trimyema compressum]